MKLAPNIKLGQLRRTVAIVSPSEWNSLTRAERDAANAITFLIWKRAHTKRHPAFGGDEIFLTKGYVQRLLKAVNATNMGEKAARTALARMQGADGSWTRADEEAEAVPGQHQRAERYVGGDIPAEGGR
jgi:hypothetical protein